MNGRIGITGATGFVGRHFLDAALSAGRDVTAFVRRSIALEPLPDRVPVVPIGDLGPDTDWTGHLAGLSCIVYLAGRAHVMRETAADPLASFRSVNRDGAVVMARAAARAGVRRFVYVSSVKAMGEETPWSRSGGVPFRADSPAHPVDPYGVSKLEAERALHAVGQETGLEIVIVRPPLIYGPGAGGNFARLIRLVRRGVPLPFGLVENRRTMIGAGNLAELLLMCTVHPAAGGRVFLAGDGEDVSTPGLIRLIGEAVNRPARLVPVPPMLLRAAGSLTGRTADIQRLLGSLQLDTGDTRRTLGWAPRMSLREGVAWTVDRSGAV